MAGIVLDRIDKSFGTTRVLGGIDLSFGAGEFISLVGPSGCGKTTLLRIIAGLEAADHGRVSIGGADVTGRRAADRDVAMVFQNYALYPHMTVEQNMALPLVMRRLGAFERMPLLGRLVAGTGARRRSIRADVEAAANVLSIGHLMDRRPGQLSGGQRQRVALGRAIVRQPQAFLMDEPLSNLDASLRHDMRKELVELHRRVGVTTVYVTHDQAEAMTMSDRVAVMRGGKVQQFGTPRDIYERPATIDVASFIGSPRINLLAAEVDSRGAVILAGRPVGLRAEAAAGPITLGIRPDHVALGASGLPATIRHVEFLGAEVLVYLAEPVTGAEVIARLAPEAWAGVEHGRTVGLGLPAGRLLAFATTGARLAMRLEQQAVPALV
ncbi:ABC transporter ATP-binding protein [Phreatobacter sp. AB_2022a]|uniref:ABC transporter ATP-binding protein n=1 Tax=Phreatobacter sp. AB_2022a TaxID=3003134 RepID=UPI002E23ECE5